MILKHFEEESTLGLLIVNELQNKEDSKPLTEEAPRANEGSKLKELREKFQDLKEKGRSSLQAAVQNSGLFEFPLLYVSTLLSKEQIKSEKLLLEESSKPGRPPIPKGTLLAQPSKLHPVRTLSPKIIKSSLVSPRSKVTSPPHAVHFKSKIPDSKKGSRPPRLAQEQKKVDYIPPEGRLVSKSSSKSTDPRILKDKASSSLSFQRRLQKLIVTKQRKQSPLKDQKATQKIGFKRPGSLGSSNGSQGSNGSGNGSSPRLKAVIRPKVRKELPPRSPKVNKSIILEPLRKMQGKESLSMKVESSSTDKTFARKSSNKEPQKEQKTQKMEPPSDFNELNAVINALKMIKRKLTPKGNDLEPDEE